MPEIASISGAEADLVLANMAAALSDLSETQTRRQPRQRTMINSIKCRHLSQDERAQLHCPAPDWQESTRGEELRHSTTLQILDILHKHGIEPL